MAWYLVSSGTTLL